GALARESREGAPRTGAPDRAQHPDVAPAARPVQHAGSLALRALRAGEGSGRRLLRLSSPGARSPRRTYRRRGRQGDVGGTLHGGAERAGALSEPASRLAAT